jgi:hypothetical protein
MRLLTTICLAAATALTLGVAHADTKKGAPAGKDMEFEPESAASTPPSKTLERAIKLYD